MPARVTPRIYLQAVVINQIGRIVLFRQPISAGRYTLINRYTGEDRQEREGGHKEKILFN